jgi:hypothetical protein
VCYVTLPEKGFTTEGNMTVVTNAKGNIHEPRPPESQDALSAPAKQASETNRVVVTIEKDANGFYRPASEEALVALVKQAYSEGKQLRVRGAVHSVATAIYTDPLVDRRHQRHAQQLPGHEGAG